MALIISLLIIMMGIYAVGKYYKPPSINWTNPQDNTENKFEQQIKTIKNREITTNVFRMIGLVILLYLISQSCTPTKTTKNEIATNPEIEISKVLASNGITGCGEFNYSLNSGQNSEYTVTCTWDGQNWKTYTVWTKINRVASGATPKQPLHMRGKHEKNILTDLLAVAHSMHNNPANPCNIYQRLQPLKRKNCRR